MTIDVDTYTAIRRLYAMQKMSQREIATRLGISRTTVARYCEGERLPGERQNKTPKRTPLQEVVEPFILECLATNEEIARKKDRMNAKVIWRRLVEEKGVDIGQSTVRRLVAKLRHKTPEAFVPLSFEPGEAMQVDWGDVHAIINGGHARFVVLCGVALQLQHLCRRVPQQKQGIILHGSHFSLRLLRWCTATLYLRQFTHRGCSGRRFKGLETRVL